MRHLPTYSLSKLFSLIAGVVAEAPFVLTEGELPAGEIAADTSSGITSIIDPR